ncbi:hypothetical protein GBF35_45785 [Nonomuraea phyllanthi]|uniref:hypothetical protein n=1 Tax=Nonomuraea phyllanthi TaxID=2219224 RepID=UPI00129395E3|nr:hypothetical protein [Nonomuraea phyllanthi]QFY12905.1 hypothetical protein GBF35_45785 [Nonomuraea phyllanthi]
MHEVIEDGAYAPDRGGQLLLPISREQRGIRERAEVPKPCQVYRPATRRTRLCHDYLNLADANPLQGCLDIIAMNQQSYTNASC